MSTGGFDLSSIPPDALSGAISQLTQHPEILSAVASAMGMPPPSQSAEPAAAEASPTAAAPSLPSIGGAGDIMSSLGPILSAMGGNVKKDPRCQHRESLLCALKPYLSDERCRLLDQILKISQFGDILKMIK